MGDQDIYRGEMRQDTPLNSALCKLWYRIWQLSGFSTNTSGSGISVSFNYPSGNPNTISLSASSSHTVPVGSFNVGILPLTGTVTIDGVAWPNGIPYNFDARIGGPLVVTTAGSSTALIQYLL